MKKFWPEAVLALAEIPLIYVGLFTDTLQLQRADATLLAAIFAQIGLIALYLSCRSSASGASLHSAIDDLRRDMLRRLASTTQIEILQQNDFYALFADAVRRSAAAVSMAHLDVSPPPSAPQTRTGSYYQELPGLIARSPNVVFKRVERLSATKWQWIQHLIRECEGSRNFSLALLDCGTDSPRIPTISVQLIDTDKVFLVAIADHDTQHDQRDIYIRDGTAALMWKRYYEKHLWEPSIVVVREGIVARSELARAEELVRSQR